MSIEIVFWSEVVWFLFVHNQKTIYEIGGHSSARPAKNPSLSTEWILIRNSAHTLDIKFIPLFVHHHLGWRRREIEREPDGQLQASASRSGGWNIMYNMDISTPAARPVSCDRQSLDSNLNLLHLLSVPFFYLCIIHERFSTHPYCITYSATRRRRRRRQCICSGSSASSTSPSSASVRTERER